MTDANRIMEIGDLLTRRFADVNINVGRGWRLLNDYRAIEAAASLDDHLARERTDELIEMVCCAEQPDYAGPLLIHTPGLLKVAGYDATAYVLGKAATNTLVAWVIATYAQVIDENTGFETAVRVLKHYDTVASKLSSDAIEGLVDRLKQEPKRDEDWYMKRIDNLAGQVGWRGNCEPCEKDYLRDDSYSYMLHHV